MATRLTLLCHAATAMSRVGGFADSVEPLDAGGLRTAAGVHLPGPAPRHVAVSPAPAAHQTAETLGLVAEIDPALRDIDHGAWTGKSLAEIHAADPEAIAAWMADQITGTPGGETMATVGTRVTAWLGDQAGRDAPVLAITHPAIVRAAIASALNLPMEAALRMDVAPLSMAILSFNRIWRLQSLGPASTSADALA